MDISKRSKLTSALSPMSNRSKRQLVTSSASTFASRGCHCSFKRDPLVRLRVCMSPSANHRRRYVSRRDNCMIENHTSHVSSQTLRARRAPLRRSITTEKPRSGSVHTERRRLHCVLVRPAQASNRQGPCTWLVLHLASVRNSCAHAGALNASFVLYPAIPKVI